jgi:hypothetical protein
MGEAQPHTDTQPHTQLNNGMLYRDAVASLCTKDKEAAQNLLASVYYAMSRWLGELTTPGYPCFGYADACISLIFTVTPLQRRMSNSLSQGVYLPYRSAFP